MVTWTLTNPRRVDGIAISDLLRDGVPVTHDVDYDAARQYIYAHADDDDLYLEAENPRYRGETVGTLKAKDADLQRYYDGAITYEEYERRWPAILVALLLILSILLPAPVQAHGSTIYLPSVENGRAWFDQQEFDAALTAAGYDPAAVTPFTWCELDATAQPPAVIRYSACTLELGGGASVVFWRTPAGMAWAMVTQ